MAAKVAYTLREDKEELQKQLGCMNGIFKLFDRRYLLGQHRHGRNQRRQTPGQSDNGEKGFKNESEKAKAKNPKVIIEKNRASVESSRNSFSSSCSSTTFSSFDCSKQVQTDLSQIVSEPAPPNLHKKQPELSLKLSDIKNVVKDSMTRETRVVPVRTEAKDDRTGSVMRHIDSPRPFVHQCDRKDRNLEKLPEMPWGVKVETSRFSCDGRELRSLSKSNLKVKELPRLSLDSKRNSIRNLANEPRRSLLDQTHEPGSNKCPPSSVVARLMGLESFMDSVDEVERLENMKIEPSFDEELVSSSRGSRKGEGLKKKGGDRSGSKKPPLKKSEAPVRVISSASSVYGEMEKRLTELEFKTSEKGLRALKQILEAMQKSDQPAPPTVKGTRCKLMSEATKPVKMTTDSMMVAGLRKVNHVDMIKLPIPQKRKATGVKSTMSPVRQRSKNGIDKQSIHGPSSGSIRVKKQPVIQPVGSVMKTTSPKIKPESNTSLASQNEPEVARTDNHRNNFAERLIEDKPMVELTKLTMEQQSPVSVLDAFYTEDTPSPVKKKPSAFSDYENSHFDETEWNREGIDNIELENRIQAIDQIGFLNSTDDEDIESYRPESKNADHKYIKDIIIFSGFLKDLDYATRMVQLHPTSTLINPELFHALEKNKRCTELARHEKIRRKMVFDTVNNILFRKLLKFGKRQGRVLNGEKLLKDVCSEIDNLQTSSERCIYDEDDEVKGLVNIDVNKASEDWSECRYEVPGIVLDIERLIFKDLISEVVNGEVARS